MSHGGGSDSVEPDLTPLLDLVMQLLMFFIINVNFLSAEVNPTIELPKSQSARPMDKPAGGDIYLNQKPKTAKFLDTLPPDAQDRLRFAESVIMVSTQEPMTMLEARDWLKRQYEAAGGAAGKEVKIRISKGGLQSWEGVIVPEPALRITRELERKP